MDTGTRPSDASVKILIAEDSPTQAQRLRHILEQQGFEAGVAVNGRLALEMAPQFRPALIISDVAMPEMDGYELSRRIKADPGLRDIPLILVTTMNDPEDVIRGLECGADNFVLKPYDERYLLGRVRYVLANREFHHPQDAGMGVELYFHDKKHYITAGRLQILNLLLSTYDAAIQRNKELNQSQESLEKRSAEVEAANRAKSVFLATMSHEIRTPMNGVLGLLELLSLTKLDAEQRTTLEIVRNSGKSLLRIIDDILDFSKIEAGKLEVRAEAASISAVLEGVHGTYSGNAISKGMRFERNVDPRISPAVLVDPVRLRQILNNFTSNALKFTHQGGTVGIGAELIERTEQTERIRFTVKDTGIGISPEAQKRLFQPFSQGETDTTRRYGGTGLGLAICLRLADIMGGSIEMASELGKGTTMLLTLSLPIADPKELPVPGAASMRDSAGTAPGMRRRTPTVEEAAADGTLALLVDDHPTNRLLLMRQAQALGYAAESAGDGIEALEKWKSGRFGIVITDCNMPQMDGYELARRIRALESASGAKRIPIIACTANALGGEAEICFAAGMDDYLAKPVELAELRRKLDQWLPIPSASVPLDRSALAAISGGDAALEREILLDFRRANDQDAATLEKAVAETDIPLVTLATHRIKGASQAIGALGLASVCERIEHASGANDRTALAACLTEFHAECKRLNAYLDAV